MPSIFDNSAISLLERKSMNPIQQIPLFPLGLVMLPDMILPLHIFEERYKEMIAECLQSERPFGIVLFDGQVMHSVGCMAHILNVSKRYNDGRLDILTQGGKRFVVQQYIEERTFMEAQVLFFDDRLEEDGSQALSGLIEATLQLTEEIQDLQIEEFAKENDADIDPKKLAFAIAALEGFTPVERQGILEMTSPSERLDKCIQALSRIADRNRLTKEIVKLIGGNGNPPQSILSALKKKS